MSFVVRRPADAAPLGVVLGVWAHPDDETYLSGGLMALARQAGSSVTCVTATRGEHGTADPEQWPPARLGRVRAEEMAAAMEILGVGDHRWLELEDETLDHLPIDDGVERVARLLDEVQPDTIVTFGPDGMTGHPDHRAVSAWATAAWRRSGEPGRLLYATTTEGFADEFAALHEELGVFGPGLPVRTPEAEVVVAVDLDDELQDLKLAALRAHATQIEPLVEACGVDVVRRWWRRETFTAAT